MKRSRSSPRVVVIKKFLPGPVASGISCICRAGHVSRNQNERMRRIKRYRDERSGHSVWQRAAPIVSRV